MDTKYFYIKENKPVGPLTLPELMEKDIYSQTQIWTKGMEKWDLLENMPELYKALQLKTENPPHFQKDYTIHFPKENTTQIKVESVTPENTFNPNKISTKTILYLIVGTLIIVMLGGYLLLKLEVEKVKAENSRIEKELMQKPEFIKKLEVKNNRIEKELKQKQVLLEKQLAEEKIKLQKEHDIISKDIDGNVYKVVKIGTQYWSGRNLNVSRFRNGDKIPVARSAEDWMRAKMNGEPTCRCYDNTRYNCEKYGRIYNWHAVNDPRGLAPEGWHVPLDYEWKNLTDFLGVSAGQILKSTEDWEGYVYAVQGTNNVDFSALPGGYINENGSDTYIGSHAFFWVSTNRKDYGSLFRNLNLYSSNVGRYYKGVYVGGSVRCIMD